MDESDNMLSPLCFEPMKFFHVRSLPMPRAPASSLFQCELSERALNAKSSASSQCQELSELSMTRAQRVLSKRSANPLHPNAKSSMSSPSKARASNSTCPELSKLTPREQPSSTATGKSSRSVCTYGSII